MPQASEAIDKVLKHIQGDLSSIKQMQYKSWKVRV